jgi:hypothetical protein
MAVLIIILWSLMLKLHEKFVIDESGKKTATILPYTEWKRVTAILEEYDDICAFDEAKAQVSAPILFKEAIKKLKTSAA